MVKHRPCSRQNPEQLPAAPACEVKLRQAAAGVANLEACTDLRAAAYRDSAKHQAETGSCNYVAGFVTRDDLHPGAGTQALLAHAHCHRHMAGAGLPTGTLEQHAQV